MDKNKMSLHLNPSMKRRPPKLKALDRSISIAIDNYTPPALITSSDPQILQEGLPLPPIVQRPDIFIIAGSSTSPVAFNDCPHHIKKNILKRSDTLNVYSPQSFRMRKTNSFHITDPTEEEILLSRRTNSEQGTNIFPQNTSHEQLSYLERRSNSNQRSLSEKKKHSTSGEEIQYLSTLDILKTEEPITPILLPPVIPFDNELLQQQNKECRLSENSIFDSSTNDLNIRRQFSKHSSHSLEKQQHFKHGVKHASSVYLSPTSLEQFKIPRSHQNPYRSHSASMRIRSQREGFSSSKKAKSFIADTYPNFELISQRRESKIQSTDDLKRSPRPTKPFIDDVHYLSMERKSPLNFDLADTTIGPAIRPFRSSHRKNSTSGSIKRIRKSLSDETEEESNADRKRKRIVCIIMTAFLCLICASVLVVIITLTHSTVTQVQNQTKKIYTFSRDAPIHYNVRQENERLMQESLNRIRFAKNFTDAALLSANIEVP